MRLLLLVPLLLLAACADDGSDAGDALVPDAPLGELTVEQDSGDGTPVSRWTLVCGDDHASDRGDHPEAGAACEHLRAADEPFAPLPADRMCTEIYGGPQTAHVTGRWRGDPVDLRLSRVDGCAIAQWDGLGPLLPGPVGVDPPA
jgi:hypothetical protein